MNPHAFALEPESSVSANSTIRASGDGYAECIFTGTGTLCQALECVSRQLKAISTLDTMVSNSAFLNLLDLTSRGSMISMRKVERNCLRLSPLAGKKTMETL